MFPDIKTHLCVIRVMHYLLSYMSSFLYVDKYNNNCIIGSKAGESGVLLKVKAPVYLVKLKSRRSASKHEGREQPGTARAVCGRRAAPPP